MRIKTVPTNEVVIEVTPRKKGNFGFIHLGGEERTAEEERRLALEIESNINRHVDDVQDTYVSQVVRYQDEDGEEFESMYDLLSIHYNEEYDPEFVYTYQNRDGSGTRGSTDSFKNLIETAYRNPNGFEVKHGRLFDEQRVFLNNVIDASITAKSK